MRQKTVASYVDSGSISLFAQQIIDVLGNILTVAIHDIEGQLVWAGPGDCDGDLWSVNPFIRERMPNIGFCERLSNKNFAYVFYLYHHDTEDPIGTLSLQIGAASPVSLEFAHQEIEPILRCIERQIDINEELSAVRRMTEDGRLGMNFLIELDELDTQLPPHEIVRSVLKLSLDHFGAEVAAVVLPKLGVQEIYPASLVQDKTSSKALMTVLGSLSSAAKLHRKVLLSDVDVKTQVLAGLQGGRLKVLCSPIVNGKDEVIGILALIKANEFPREHVRLSRAICAKINTLMRTTSQLAENHFSRHGFLGHVAAIMQRDPNQSHAMLLVDIDKLHVVNDNFGHMAGDTVIRTTSRLIDEIAGADDAVAHLAGDTFAVFFRNAGENEARNKADVLLDSIGKEIVEYDSKSIQVSASIGIALIPDVVADAAAAVNTAEVAARSAKGRGGNRMVIFKDLDASVVQRRSDLDQVNYLQSALIDGRFVLYAQPIVSLKDEESSHRYEVLLRMIDENGQLLSPDKFLSAAERYQMMSAIDRWVIRSALDQLSASDNLLEISLGSFSINISAQSLADDDFLDFVETQIAQSGVSPDALCFEITETSIVRNLERAQRFIKRLRKLGCRLALDDFGTGYCSFAYLKDLHVQYVKIDGVFVRDILENPLSEAIVVALTNIAKVMFAATIAEHVENDLVKQQLRQYNVDFVQGFGIGKPQPLSDVLNKIGELPDLDLTRQAQS